MKDEKVRNSIDLYNETLFVWNIFSKVTVIVISYKKKLNARVIFVIRNNHSRARPDTNT